MKDCEQCAIDSRPILAKQLMLTSICTAPPSLFLCFACIPAAMATNKIRMDFIESEMAKRYRRDNSTEVAMHDTPSAAEPKAAALSSADLPQREPASLGKLHEIDLGHETTLQNIARTEAATKRLAGDGDQSPPTEQSSGPKMAPANGDQKTWRNRKRRTSEDIERDRLVEEVLRESKCESSLRFMILHWDQIYLGGFSSFSKSFALTYMSIFSGCLRGARRGR